MGNVRRSFKFGKKLLNVNFDVFGLTISLNSETIMKELAILKRSASGALSNLTLQVMSAIPGKADIKGNVGTSNQIRDSVQILKEFRRE